MTSSARRLYLVALAILVLFLSWAFVAARPWSAHGASAVDPRVLALEQREARLRHDAALVNKVVQRRWRHYRVALRRRQAAIAAAKAKHRNDLAAARRARLAAIERARRAAAYAAAVQAAAVRSSSQASVTSTSSGTAPATSTSTSTSTSTATAAAAPPAATAAPPPAPAAPPPAPAAPPPAPSAPQPVQVVNTPPATQTQSS